MNPDAPRSSDRGFALFVSGLALLISMAALLAVAFKLNDDNSQTAAVVSPRSSSAQLRAEDVKIVVKSDEEHGRVGSDGSWHDAFLPADFSVKAGSVVRVTVYNYDEGPHTFTSTGLGTNVTIPGGSEAEPSKTTFTFRAPEKAGRYEWFCAFACDPWAMSHVGFMRGFVTVA
jgi:plastocyanin